jgi:hypothetical protein
MTAIMRAIARTTAISINIGAKLSFFVESPSLVPSIGTAADYLRVDMWRIRFLGLELTYDVRNGGNGGSMAGTAHLEDV